MAILTAQLYSAEVGGTLSRAVRAQTTAASLEAAIGDVSWTCLGDRCVGTGPLTGRFPRPTLRQRRAGAISLATSPILRECGAQWRNNTFSRCRA